MDINNAFPSKWLRSSDLMGREVRVTIERVEMETLGEDKRPIAYFRNKQKGLVLNKTNANTIADMYGFNTDHWIGKEIVIYPTRVDFKGERVDAIRVQFNQPALPKTSQKAVQHSETDPPPTNQIPAHADMNDEIPF